MQDVAVGTLRCFGWAWIGTGWKETKGGAPGQVAVKSSGRQELPRFAHPLPCMLPLQSPSPGQGPRARCLHRVARCLALIAKSALPVARTRGHVGPLRGYIIAGKLVWGGLGVDGEGMAVSGSPASCAQLRLGPWRRGSLRRHTGTISLPPLTVLQGRHL